MQFDLEQIAQLAPDAQSMTAARQSMSPRLWSQAGLLPDVIWGQCLGSTFYHVAVDLQSFGYKCSCPSRKRPCRHVLALMLLLVTTPDALTETEPPATVREWIEKRRAKASKPEPVETEAPKPVDPVAQQKRAGQREDRVARGIQQLESWLMDLVRNGLAGLEIQGMAQWELQAKRLVDAQASGLANRVRAMGEIPASSPDWPERLLFAMGRLQLLLEAYKSFDILPQSLQSDVRQLIGWNVTQQELEATGERVVDVWQVVGQREEIDDRLRVLRTWLYGLESQRFGLVIQFSPGKQPYPELYMVGTSFRAELTFYPGGGQERVRVQERADPISTPRTLSGFQSLEEILEQFSERLAVAPWTMSATYVLANSTVSSVRGRWYLRDREGRGAPLRSFEPWKVLAETGGLPANIVLEWNGDSAQVLGLEINQRYIGM
ncbi:SWIM zinc finger family protein [Planctomicrobium sp. SH668]|uniref:SWIM zinc finger family protein n=1 Tax=Planctomicrobium sp. SH668 TaxID=3448126 RepID=UPI003F5C2AA1